MTRPTKSIILQNYTLELLMLPLNSRVIVPVTISMSAALENAGEVTLASSAGVAFSLKAGTSLSFGASGQRRHQVLLLEDVAFTPNATPGDPGVFSPLSPKVARIPRDIPGGVTAEFITGLVPLFGIQGFDLQSQETTVDITNTQSGSGMESTMVRFDRTIAVSGVTMQGDRTLETIVKRIVFDTAYTNREVYAVATYPNGEKYQGAAKIMGYSSPGNQNEVAKYQFNLQFQGDTLIRTQAYSFS